MNNLKGYDNTKLGTYKSCPRKYYYRHVRNWRREGISVHLVFGLAWHESMDAVWQMLSKGAGATETLSVAYDVFLNQWTEDGLPDPRTEPQDAFDQYKAKTPGVAQEMLYHYINHRAQFLSNIELMAVEKPFMVPLYPGNDELFYIGRLDKVFRWEGTVKAGEHKTTGMYAIDGGFQSSYLEQWSPNSQIDGYNFAGRMLYGEDFHSVWVDAALAHKKVHDKFKFIPVDRSIQQLDAWLYETREWISRIMDEEYNLELYRQADPNQKPMTYLPGFAKNTNSCIDFGSPCPYKDICQFNANPENLDGIPEGFVEDEWQPFDILGITQMLEESNE